MYVKTNLQNGMTEAAMQIKVQTTSRRLVSMMYLQFGFATLQNYKCIIGTRATAVLAEYTYNGNDGVLYEDIYKKIVNASHSVK